MIRKQDILLEKLGYDVTSHECVYFKTVVEEVMDSMDEFSMEEVKELVQNKKSYIYVEPACFCFEIGLNRFHQDLNQFHNLRNSASCETMERVFGSNQNPTLEDSIFEVAKYISDKSKKRANKSSEKKLTMILTPNNISKKI